MSAIVYIIHAIEINALAVQLFVESVNQQIQYSVVSILIVYYNNIILPIVFPQV